jgi:hypothetical protein
LGLARRMTPTTDRIIDTAVTDCGRRRASSLSLAGSNCLSSWFCAGR